ncbi:MAG: alpha/beta fold hydrolase [Acidimicrobiales bacterium]
MSGSRGVASDTDRGLYCEVTGTGPRVVLAHGFTQTGASWRPLVAELAGDLQVVTVDLPGHGGSGAIGADLPTAAGLLGEVGGPATYVGYSMGGRVALRLALDVPDLVARLVLIGATAGIEDPGERAARRASDEALAERIERDGVERFLTDWLAQPLFGSLVPAADDLAARRANSTSGLASSLRLAGTATMDPPWWDELGRIDAPTLVLAGERDAKFVVIGGRLVKAIGANAQLASIEGADHAAHLERPSAVAQAILTFIA